MAVIGIGIGPMADTRNCPKMANSVTKRDWTLDLVRSLSVLRDRASPDTDRCMSADLVNLAPGRSSR